jgi:hypothetical protein
MVLTAQPTRAELDEILSNVISNPILLGIHEAFVLDLDDDATGQPSIWVSVVFVSPLSPQVWAFENRQLIREEIYAAMKVHGIRENIYIRFFEQSELEQRF